MAFRQGRVTFSSFRVTGEAPVADEALLAALKKHAFRETDIGAPDEVEAGWITGEHLLDVDFTYEKNLFGPRVLFGLRVDTHKVPADVKQAYRKINEQAAATQSATGFISTRERREAAELAGRQAAEDLANGLYRRSKIVPVLWDAQAARLYAPAASQAVEDELRRLMRETFDLGIEPLSAGSRAAELLVARGGSRTFDDLQPSRFTDPPPDADADRDEADGPRDRRTPAVPWVNKSAEPKDFLGNEFAIYLWHLVDSAGGDVPYRSATGADDVAQIAIDRTLEMDCAWGARGKQSLRSTGPARLPEARRALATGKWPRKLGLIVSDGEHAFDCTLHADRLIVSSAALPKIEDVETNRELTERRIDLTLRLADLLDRLYERFVSLRSEEQWSTLRSRIRRWITSRAE